MRIHFFAQHDIADEHAKHYEEKFYELVDLQVISNTIFPSASVRVKKGTEEINSSAVGSGPIDALYSAILKVTDIDMKLLEYKISSVSRGKEALGKVKVSAEFNGNTYFANATDTDVIKASALAYINVINKIVVENLLTVS